MEMILTIFLFIIYYQMTMVYNKPLDIELDTPLTISFNPPIQQIQLNQPLIIKCEVHSSYNNNNNNKNILNSYSMFFQCPLSPWGKFCFHNCQSACISEKPNQCPNEYELSLIKCRTSITNQGYLFYEYTIPNLTKTWLTYKGNGNNDTVAMVTNQVDGFSCKIAGLQTPLIPLRIMNTNEIPPIKILESIKTKETFLSPGTQSIISMGTNFNKTISNEYHELSQIKNGMNQSIKGINYELKAALTREILIIGAIIIVFISVILNVFCCIRCALIRQYSKSKDRPHMQHLFCMAEEIRNARIVKQINGKGYSYRDKIDHEQHHQLQQHQQQHRLTNYLHDGHKTSGRGSSLFLMNKIQPQSNSYESYQPSIDYGSEYLNSLNCHGLILNDNQSSNGLPNDIPLRYLPDGKSGNRQSISAFSLIPGQLPISWINHTTNIDTHRRSISSIQRNGTNNSLISNHSSQQQITEAVTNFYLQHQEHFKELQNHLNNQNNTIETNPLNSDGINSCIDSIGQPDSSILSEINIIPSNLINCESPITNNHHQNHQNQASIKNIIPSTMNQLSTYMIPMDSTNHLIQNYSSSNINRTQPIGSSQSQLITLINKLHNSNNSNITTTTTNNNNGNSLVHNEQTFNDTLNSQSDSGACTGSGKISINSS
uniref:ZP domain-containing protein n=1 Tax=Schistosoma mansoni TaxID=6183 RepID=A0A5K4FAF9_SCHMA